MRGSFSGVGRSVAALFLLSGALSAWTDAAADLARAARSPYDLARFIDTHSSLDWALLLRELKIEPEHLPDCADRGNETPACSTELITVVEPFQVILVLHEEVYDFEAFFRYRRVRETAWRFAGLWVPYVKYFPPRHRMLRLGTKPVLAVTGQGISGTGLSSEVEHWIDLTSDNFEPFFDYIVHGNHLAMGDGLIGRKYHGSVTSLRTDPIERIVVSFKVEFNTYQNEAELRLGDRTDDAAYVRSENGKFVLDPSRSTASAKDLESLYGDSEVDLRPAVFLRLNIESLRKLAAGDNTPARRWLRRFLTRCPDTPEARSLKAAFASRPKP